MDKIFIVYITASRKNGTLYVGVSGDPVGRIRLIEARNPDWRDLYSEVIG